MKIKPSELTDNMRIVSIKDRFGGNERFYDDGDGKLYVLRNSMGIQGFVRADTWDNAFSIAEDELFPEADITMEEIVKDYNFHRQRVKIVRDLTTGEERPVVDSDYPLQPNQFVRWETINTSPAAGEHVWMENELFQEAYDFRPNGSNARDKHNHGIYAKDLNGEALDLVTDEFVKEIELTIEVEKEDDEEDDND